LLIAGLQGYFATNKDDAGQPAQKISQNSYPEPAGVPDCLPNLLQLLKEGDSDVIELWGKHNAEFASVMRPQQLDRISIALQNFEFDTVQALLEELSADRQPISGTE
ncbi:MAG: hypothetical protein PHU01_15855, partial [Desulfuromonadaceae bacterium]|nr:hypothetical protein [Desulfuromonadaceae bacterium]